MDHGYAPKSFFLFLENMFEPGQVLPAFDLCPESIIQVIHPKFAKTIPFNWAIISTSIQKG
jgi:hypothetical protein